MKLPIEATEYILTKPEHFEMRKHTITSIPVGHTILSPLYTAICGSDLQYYKGEKSTEKLKKRLPLVPLHEGICLDLKTNKRVIPIAGDFLNVPPEFKEKENTWPALPYLGATMPGLTRTHFIYPKKLTIPVPDSIDSPVASIIEPLSVAIQSASQMDIKKTDRVAIIGTGGLAFLIALVLRFTYGLSKSHIQIFGMKDEKLSVFTSIAHVVNYSQTSRIQEQSFQKVFEAVGRKHITMTMTTGFQIIQPGGMIGVLGISESPYVLPIEQLVNRQITVKGLTRSRVPDYHEALSLLQNKSVAKLIKNNLIGSDIITMRSTKDLKAAFDFAETSKAIGRIVLRWPQEN